MQSLGPRVGSLDLRTAKPLDKRADAYYGSPEHRAWRKVVIERAGGYCEWPGCGRKERRMFADHKVERADGGDPQDPANGQCLCGAHHTIKTNQERAKRTGRG